MGTSSSPTAELGRIGCCDRGPCALGGTRLRRRPRLPFGIAFYPPGPHPQYLYVAENSRVVRFPSDGMVAATSAPRWWCRTCRRAPADCPAGATGPGTSSSRPPGPRCTSRWLLLQCATGRRGRGRSRDGACVRPGRRQSAGARHGTAQPGVHVVLAARRALWVTNNERDELATISSPTSSRPLVPGVLWLAVVLHRGEFYPTPRRQLSRRSTHR